MNDRKRDSSADSINIPTPRSIYGEDKEAKPAAVGAVSVKRGDDCPAAAAGIASKGSAARLRFLFGKDRSLRRRKRKSQSHSSLATSSASEMAVDPPPKQTPGPPVESRQHLSSWHGRGRLFANIPEEPLASSHIWASQFPGGVSANPTLIFVSVYELNFDHKLMPTRTSSHPCS